MRAALLALAERHRDTVYGAHTHTQPAQPTTIAHYLLAVIEQLERDTDPPGGGVRLDELRTRSAPARSPARASRSIAQRTSELLGFNGPTGNTYGSIATVDYLLESVSATSVLLVGLGRVVQDLLLWCTMEFGYLRLATASCRAAASCRRSATRWRSSTRARSAARPSARRRRSCTTVHNTPFGDIVDTEDDLQPLVASMFRDATRMVTLVAAAMRDADFDVRAAGVARRRSAAPRSPSWPTRWCAITACRSARRTPSRRCC